MSVKYRTIKTSYLGVKLEGKVQYSPKHLVLTMQSPLQAICLKREIDFFVPKMFTDSYAEQTAETLLKEIFENCLLLKTKKKEFLESVSSSGYRIGAEDLRRDLYANRRTIDILKKALKENRLTSAEFQQTYFYVRQYGRQLNQQLNQLIEKYYRTPIKEVNLHGRSLLNASRQVFNLDISPDFQLIQSGQQYSFPSPTEDISQRKLTVKDCLEETTQTLKDGREITEDEIAEKGTFAIIPLWKNLFDNFGGDFEEKITLELCAKLFFNGFKLEKNKYCLLIADCNQRDNAPEIIEKICKNYMLQPHIYTGLYNTDGLYEKIFADIPGMNAFIYGPQQMISGMIWAAKAKGEIYKKLQEKGSEQIETYSEEVITS